MALYRQGSGPYQVGMPPPGNGDHRPGSPFRLHDHVKAEQKGYLGLVRSRSMKAKRLGRSSRSRKCSIGAIALVLLVGVVVTIFGTDYVFPLVRNFKGWFSSPLIVVRLLMHSVHSLCMKNDLLGSMHIACSFT